MQLFQRVAQVIVVCILYRVQAAEHHRRRLAIARQRLCRRMNRICHRIAYPGFPYGLYSSRQEPYFTGGQHLHIDRRRLEHTDLRHIIRGAGSHHLDLHALTDRAVVDPQIQQHAFIGIKFRIKHQRL